jgi:hypothetical protein
MGNVFIKYSYLTYCLIYCIFIFRYSVLDITLGYGLGDLFYLILFSICLIIGGLIFVVLRKKKSSFLKTTFAIVNIICLVYLLLLMFVIHGSEYH